MHTTAMVIMLSLLRNSATERMTASHAPAAPKRDVLSAHRHVLGAKLQAARAGEQRVVQRHSSAQRCAAANGKGAEPNRSRSGHTPAGVVVQMRMGRSARVCTWATLHAVGKHWR